ADEPVQQPQASLVSSGETVAMDWQGVPGRTYFMEWSLDLVNWQPAPFLGFGDGAQSFTMETAEPRAFFRIRFRDDPDVDSLEEAAAADFDGDNLSNGFEAYGGLNANSSSSVPGESDATGDADKDGAKNTTEQQAHTNPMVRDHPLLLLEVSKVEAGGF
ncbi:MAG: hypothetical protein V4733_03175, partial [Verrucomicrobiota bacterium]